MRFFRPKKPLHQKLAEASPALFAGAAGTWLGQPPDWNGDPRPLSLVSIHGAPRARRWDVVASATAPGLRGDAVHFVALEDGTLVVDEDEPDDSLAPLAEAVEATISPPYRADAVRHDAETWAVAANRIAIAEVADLTGDEAELTSTRDGRTLKVDGFTTLGSARTLERLGEAEGSEYVVRAKRLDGDLWEVEATAL